MPDSIAAAVGRRVRELRKESGLGTREFAERAGISPSFVSLVEKGEANPTLDKLDVIAKTLGVPARDLFPRSPSAASMARERPVAYRASLPQHVAAAARKIAALPEGTRSKVLTAVQAVIKVATKVSEE